MGLLSFLLEPRLPSMLSANTTTNYLAIVLLIVTFLAHSVVQVFFRGQKPNATPWSPSGHHGMFAALQSALISTLDVRRILTLGGLLPGAQKTGFMISTALDGASVVLPMRNLKWLVAQSEETASFHAIHHERLQLRYTLPVAAFANLSVSRLAARVLTRRSKSTIPDIHEEIETMCTNAPYGHDVQWQPVTLYPEMQRILAATTNRLLVGLPLCRDPEYLRMLPLYVQSALPAALFIQLFPRVLRPLVGGIFRVIRDRTYSQRLLAKLVPHISELMKAEGDTNKRETFVSWWGEEIAKMDCQFSGPDSATQASAVVLGLNFAGIHTTAIATTTTIYRILSFKHATDLMKDIRDEIGAATSGRNGYLDWACLERMKILDSVIRESLRLSPADTVAVPRVILEETMTPDGLRLKAGTKVCVPASLAHLDERCYLDANTFNPYRFVGQSGAGGPTTAPMISENFLSWSYGEHSCPGRWFATAEIKLIIVHLLSHYELKPIARMPTGFHVGTMPIPSMSYKIHMKAREGTKGE